MVRFGMFSQTESASVTSLCKSERELQPGTAVCFVLQIFHAIKWCQWLIAGWLRRQLSDAPGNQYLVPGFEMQLHMLRVMSVGLQATSLSSSVRI